MYYHLAKINETEIDSGYPMNHLSVAWLAIIGIDGLSKPFMTIYQY